VKRRPERAAGGGEEKRGAGEADRVAGNQKATAAGRREIVAGDDDRRGADPVNQPTGGRTNQDRCSCRCGQRQAGGAKRQPDCGGAVEQFERPEHAAAQSVDEHRCQEQAQARRGHSS